MYSRPKAFLSLLKFKKKTRLFGWLYITPKKSCYKTKEFPQMKQLAPRNEKIQANKRKKKKTIIL
jgi:hypothetical protein